jgi:SPP1 family predicted phage head-tail adaptor
MFASRITLIKVEEKKDRRGDIVELKTERRVWADIKTATRSEFYQAQTAGMKAEFAITMWAHEYHGEERIEHGREAYEVIRSFIAKNDYIELVCRRGVR